MTEELELDLNKIATMNITDRYAYMFKNALSRATKLIDSKTTSFYNVEK